LNSREIFRIGVSLILYCKRDGSILANRISRDLESKIMALAAMIYRRFVRVVANIARLIAFMGGVGVRFHFFSLGCNFRVITVAALANRGLNLLGRRVFLMAALAIETDLFVFIGQKLLLGRPC
jgi:hypothetical protein